MNSFEEPVNERKWPISAGFVSVILIIAMVCFLLGNAVQPCETVEASEVKEPAKTIYISTRDPKDFINDITIIPLVESTVNPEVIEEFIEEVPKYSEEDVELLATVIYQEAGADYCCDDCRRRVADVVLNRVESDLYPDSIHEVLTQECQYGRFHWTGVVWPSSADYECNAHAVERARRIAREVLEGNHSELYGNSYYGQAGFTQGIDGFWCCGIYFAKF